MKPKFHQHSWPVCGHREKRRAHRGTGQSYPWHSVRFFFAEFLEARIIPERIEHWIEPEQRRSERQV